MSRQASIGASAAAACSPFGVSGMSVRPVCLPDLLHSVSPCRSRIRSPMARNISAMEIPRTAGPLAGLRVLDLTRALAGPFATMVLGDLGADVIKVEDIWHGDDTRRWGPPFQGDDAAYFLSINRNKRALSVNMKMPAGRDIVRRLAAGSDILVEN